MASSLSWLDHDSAAASRSMQLLSLFKQPEARDELGIGGIRDAIADQLFPGTSTIQTRLRYAFFIPWLFEEIESRSPSASKFPGAAREAENQLLAALVSNVPPEVSGVIGRGAGSALKRLPSSIYWSGLSSWGLRNFEGSVTQYFAQVEHRRAQQRLNRSGDADDHIDTKHGPWHARLAGLRPLNFPAGATLSLERKEAAFLLDQWKRHRPESLLTWLAMDLANKQPPTWPEQIWEHVRFAEFPPSLRDLVFDAQRFDALIHGAALLYNLQLAEMESNDKWVSEHGAALASWAEVRGRMLQEFDLSKFWPKVMNKGHSISTETRHFAQEWLQIATQSNEDISTSTRARLLIETRERRLKGNRSRFKNPSARQQWRGSAGLNRLSYRWPVAKDFLQEWHAGWSKK